MKNKKAFFSLTLLVALLSGCSFILPGNSDSSSFSGSDSSSSSIDVSSSSFEGIIDSFSLTVDDPICPLYYTRKATVNIVPSEYLPLVKLRAKNDSEIVLFDDSFTIIPLEAGNVDIEAYIDDNNVSNTVSLIIYDYLLTTDVVELDVNKEITINLSRKLESDYQVVSSDESVLKVSSIDDTKITIQALKEGKATFSVTKSGVISSNELEITVLSENPYKNVDRDEFYKNYTPSTSATDAKYRSEMCLMSGELTPSSGAPTVSSYQKESEGKLIHNNLASYSNDKLTYYVYDSYGKKVQEIYKNGAYISLEEVAAYIYAFGDIPVNYTSDTKTSPSSSLWGKYLRVNHSKFYGSEKYWDKEPGLPRIDGRSGDLQYYEVDIGGTNYNNGSRITRGAFRIVYSRLYTNGYSITSTADRYVFYTYNHYSDFQEYLNYKNGWGYRFGSETSGGYPSPYIETIRGSLI